MVWVLRRSQFLYPDPPFLCLSFWEVSIVSSPHPWCQR